MNLIIILGNYDLDICRARCACAAKYFKRNFKYEKSDISDDVYPSHRILCSGAGRRLTRENVSEAQHMKSLLVEKFEIDCNHIDVEEKSNNTEENLFFSKKLIFGLTNEEGFTYNSIIRNIIVCTSRFHINRSIIIAKEAFADSNVEILALFDKSELISENQITNESLVLRKYIDGVVKKLMC